MATNDLEVQDHIIQYQLPIAVQRFDIGLIVMDSVAANFRAEHETGTAKGLANRAVDLMKLGNMLRRIARNNDIAVLVTNQVSDRFDDARTIQDRFRSSSPAFNSSPAIQRMPPPSSLNVARDDRVSLDHQQRFFTGWGAQPTIMYEQMKTPALGLAWANQLSARVVLKMESERVSQHPSDYIGGNIWKDKKKKRFLSVVFAPWVAPTERPVEYEIQMQGPVFVPEPLSDPHAELLDPSLWFDGGGDMEDEFP
jgi:DNA repair protein RAD57